MNRFLLLCAGFLVAGNVCTVHAGSPIFLGKGVDTWRKELNKPQASARRSAAFALGRLGDQATGAVLDLVRCLRDDDAGVREMAASALGDIAAAAKGRNATIWKDSGGWLNKLLKEDPSPRARRAAAYALGAFGPQAAGAVDTLKDALGSKEPSVRQNAAWALGQIGPQAADAVDALRACLKDDNPLVRRDAAGAFGSMGEAGANAGNALMRLLKDERDSIVKKSALDSLSRFAGPKQAEFAEDLKPLLDEKDPEIRLNAAIVLARIGGETAVRAVPVLRSGLRDPDPQVREMVASALALPNSGEAAKAAMGALAEALSDQNNKVPVRRYAALAISHIGPDAKEIVPTVAQALKRDQPKEVRQYAAEALAQIKYPANKEAVPAMLDAIRNDSDDFVRQKCVWAFFGVKSAEELRDLGAEEVLKKVLNETGEKMALVRYDAARKLASVLGPDSPDKTIDVLLEMYSNDTLKVYNGTDANVEGGTEARASSSRVKENLGGSARYMAVQAMGWLGSKGKANDKIMKAIKEAADSRDEKLSKAGKQALEDVNK
jgi:HEAT repeat protein